MGKSLQEIAKQLENKRKVQLIYAFNGTGKTRLSREFRHLVSPKNNTDEQSIQTREKIIYYNAFTEDLFYWDNFGDFESILNIHNLDENNFTDWILQEQGQSNNIINYFQHYTNKQLNVNFDQYFSKVTFSIPDKNNIKISKGEESCFIWSVFYSLLQQVIDSQTEQNEWSEEDQNNFPHNLEYVFIDDPVSSLDDNHLIELAVDIAQLIKKSKKSQLKLKFIITTHNPLFHNVLQNELNNSCACLILNKQEDGTFVLEEQKSDAPFAYHLYLIKEMEQAIDNNQIKKYHFHFLRNVLEKTATFLGYHKWYDLLPKPKNPSSDNQNPYKKRLLNLYSHSRHAEYESIKLSDDDKKMFSHLLRHLKDDYKFQTVKQQEDES